MVFHYKCLCMNITLDLVEEPTPIDQTNNNLPWVHKTNWKSILKGKLSLGGVQPVLVKTKTLGEGYTMSTCVNCGCELFVFDAKTSQYFLKEIPQVSLTSYERLKDLGHHTYSKVFNMVLKEDEEAEKSLLEAPDESDVEAFQIFSALQTQLKSALAEEDRLMEQRIEAFKQEQQEALKQFQTKTYHDRKLLWHRVSEVLFKPSTPSFSNRHRSESPLPPKPVALTPVASPKESPILTNKNLVIIEDYEVSAQPKGERRPSVIPPEVYNPKPLVLPEVHSSSEGPAMFEFDEETESRERNRELAKEQQQQEQEEEKIEEPEPEIENYRVRSVVKVSTDLFGTSLPVSIPKQQAVASTFHPRTALQKEKDSTKDKSVKPPPIISKEFVGSSEDEDEISKSFEVPLSLNSTLYRRLKTEL